MSHTEKKEQSVLWLSFYAGLLFAAAEFVFSIFSGSQSALMDAECDREHHDALDHENDRLNLEKAVGIFF